MGRSRYKIINPELPHFITMTVLHWIPVFTRSATVAILLDALRYLMSEGLTVYAYVILENHCHLVVQSQSLDRDIARLKSYTAKQLIVYLNDNHVNLILDQLAFYKKAHKTDRAYQFWQEGIYPEWIQNNEMMRQKIDYIHNNPVKRGYVDEPFIGAIPVREIIWGKLVCWRFVRNGEFGMHSHAGAWERETGAWSEADCQRRVLPLIAFTEHADATEFRKNVIVRSDS